MDVCDHFPSGVASRTQVFQLVGNQPQWHRLHELSAIHDGQNGKEYVIEPDKIVLPILLDELFEWRFLVNLSPAQN